MKLMLEYVPGADGKEHWWSHWVAWKDTMDKGFAALGTIDSQAESYVIKHTNGRPSGPEDSCWQQQL